MNEDVQLLRRYVEGRSESAFAELVSRHIDLVYSAALRCVGGDAHLAQDVTQTVFADLARKARGLSHHRFLTGWLYQAARYTASKAVRTERRRTNREKEAVDMQYLSSQDSNWEQLRPVLDDAMGRLGAGDRDAVLLRYFEGKELRAVGDALGTSEEAARKRVGRALERLRRYLTGRGVTLSSAALAAVLSGNAVQSAPVVLAGAITTATVAGAAAAAAGSTFNLLNLMSMTKIKAGLLSAALVAGVGTPIVIQHQSVSRLRAENVELREQSRRLEPLREANQSFAALPADADELERLRSEVAEIHRLRAEVARLRREQESAALLQAENAQLNDQLGRLLTAQPKALAPTPEQEVYKQQRIERMNHAKKWMLGIHLFAQEHNDVVPVDFTQVLARLPEDFKDEELSASAEHFEIVYTGRLSEIAEPNKVIVIRERDAHYDSQGQPTRTYGFADGHSELHGPRDGNFERFEKERMIPIPAQ